MGLSGAVQWWDEWQLRVLVLGSLFVQYLLFFSSVVRRRAPPSWLRLVFWLAYLGQLAAGLEVLWAPVLLIHLGGQHLMTAYSIEDNELWRRQAITMVSQSCVFIMEMETEKVSQHNLLSFCARKKRPTFLMKLATLVCYKDYVNMHCYIEHAPTTSSLQVVELVHGYVTDGWKGYIHDAASYKRFNLHRGQWALRHQRHLRWSLNMPFDRSVLLWHIAIDICFHHQSTTPRGRECAARSRVISNYMTYLLSIRPEMLISGSRIGIFTIACEDIELMLGDNSALHDERGLAQGILSRAQQPSLLDNTSIIGTACRLAKMLMELQDELERWEVVQGVWVEMLCYSASRCRGYLHAKNMSEVTELLTRVWFFLISMGMETLADRFQKSEYLETKEENAEEDDNDGENRVVVERKINMPI
ncbi:unnamed protein product [Triticum turgidum subsp. durum]|uniref:DUF4220 domain-containing protein n=1 Tax=Triticum turgidum subsp. durum TaxID=4567 RepID=A0A9R1BTL5_TRITD|nr:unnamed protein product [Triticum turgidum subsp. durum]